MKRIEKFEVVKNICNEVNQLALQIGNNYIEAITSYCEMKGLDIEYVAEAVSKSPMIVSRLEQSAENLNFFKRSAKLPI